MAIQDDFTIYPWSKVIRHTANTNTYTLIQFYSWLMDVFDEPGMMTYQRPMKYNTPTSYTMLNGWFLDNGEGSELLKYLYGGSIDTSGYATVPDPVYVLDLTSTTDAVAGDKDKRIEDDATIVGPLLAYLNDYPVANSARIWVRDTRVTPATILGSSTIAMTTDAGTFAGTANGDSVAGDEIYTNIYTIASFPSLAPQVYIFQNGERIEEWSGFDNWDRGSIDVLIPVKVKGALIDSGNVTVFAHQSRDTFTYVIADLSSGSRTPVATETSPDTVNITKGEHYLFYDNEAGGGISVGDIIRSNATDAGSPPNWYAEVIANNDYGTSGCLTLVGLREKVAIADNNAIYVGTTQRGLVVGTPGDTYVTYDASATPPAPGDLSTVCTGGTSTAKRILRGYIHDGPGGKLVLQDDPTTPTGDNRKPYYRNFLDNDNLTSAATLDVTLDANSVTLISGYNDITVAHINGTVAAGTFSGSFIIGEKVTWDAGASSGIVVYTDQSTTLTLANVTSPDTISGDTITGQSSTQTCVAAGNLVDSNTQSFAFEQQSGFDYSVFIEAGSIYEAGRDLDDVYAYLQFLCRDGSSRSFYTSDGSSITVLEGQEYIKADAAYTATKTAPFGTLAGGVFFGAQGVWIEGMDGTDANNIKLTDDLGNPQEPYASVLVTITNTRADDAIAVFLEGINLLPDKAQYTSHNTANVQGDSTFERDATNFPIDTPAIGTFIVVDTSAKEEHRYRYDSWATTVLTMPTPITGTADGSTTGQTLEDTGKNFTALGVQRGDIIRNTTDNGWGYVLTVGTTTLTTTQLTTAGKDWASGDGYNIHGLVVTYNNTDKFFIPYIDAIEDTGTEGSPGSIQVSLLYLQPRAVVIRARGVGGVTPIVPFSTNSDILSGGMTVAVIRTEDEVYTP